MRRVLAIVVLGLALGLVTGAAAARLPGEQRGAAPWGANNGKSLIGRLRAVGLAPLPREYFNLHIHQHLDVYANGRHVTVPANIGIDRDQQYISPVHTHDESGVIHIESPVAYPFAIYHFFAVWGVRFDPGHIGGYRATKVKPLRVYANGSLVKGDFRLLRLTQHEEIAVVYGRAPRHIPKSYDFAPGL